MAPEPVAWITQLGFVLQVLFVGIGLVMALAGRFVHDLSILLTGFLIGSVAGLSFAPSVVVALDFGSLTGLAATGLLVVICGAIGATIAWQAYVFVVFITGAAIGYFGLKAVLGVDPANTFATALSMLLGLAVAGAFLIMAAGPGLMGVGAVLAGYASIARHDELTRFLMRIKFLDEDAQTPSEARMGTVQSSVIILVGLFLVILQAAMLLWPVTQGYLFDIPMNFVTSLTDEMLLSGGVLIGAVVAGMVGWLIHRVTLVIQTAAVGAVMVSVAGSAPTVLQALVALEIRGLVGLVEVASLTFVVVFVVGIIVQSGATLAAGEG